MLLTCPPQTPLSRPWAWDPPMTQTYRKIVKMNSRPILAWVHIIHNWYFAACGSISHYIAVDDVQSATASDYQKVGGNNTCESKHQNNQDLCCSEDPKTFPYNIKFVATANRDKMQQSLSAHKQLESSTILQAGTSLPQPHSLIDSYCWGLYERSIIISEQSELRLFELIAQFIG